MDLTHEVARMKEDPAFAQNVGIVLVHHVVVRGWSKAGHRAVERMEVRVDQARVDALVSELSRRPGIHKILVEARTGELAPGDDLLFAVVAGDRRANANPVLDELRARIKSDAQTKTERLS
jgi:molybdopterin synthase catalytic subunit